MGDDSEEGREETFLNVRRPHNTEQFAFLLKEHQTDGP
jgi:hypothetical protein